MEDTDNLFYIIPNELFDQEINNLTLLPLIYIQRYKSILNDCIVSPAILLKYYGLDEHHRKVANIKESFDILSRASIIKSPDIVDKNTLVRCEWTLEDCTNFVGLRYFEFDRIIDMSIKSGNYNLLNIFLAIKRNSSLLNFKTNLYSSTEVGYTKIGTDSGIKNPRRIREAIDLLVESGVLKLFQETKNNVTKNRYSFYDIKLK